jgi:predicted transcriptional regulator
MESKEDRGHALTIRLPEDLHERLKERAAEDESTIAGVLRLAARQYLRGGQITAV